MAWRVVAICLSLAFGTVLIQRHLRGWAAVAPRVNLTVAPLGQDQTLLNWQITGAGGISSILIYRSLSATENFAIIRTAAANATTHTDQGLTPGSTYYYQIKIRNSFGAVILSSSVVSAKTSGDPPKPSPTPTPTPTPAPAPTPSPTPTPDQSPTAPTTPDKSPGLYVAPNGSPNGNGTLERPLDLATALSTRSPARPGATIWLRGGVYRGSFVSNLSGSSQSPITVRQYPGERATIDGDGNPGSPLTINGAYAIYWGFEVTNSGPDRVRERPTGINVLGHHIKLINLVAHDTGIGIGFWMGAIDSEIYGCVVYRNGWQGPAPDRGHGHGIYAQNAEGTKRIVDNIVFDQYGYGIHNYTQAGELKGFHIEGNIIFNNGSASTPHDAGFPNILVGGLKPAERITIANNYTYYPNGIYATNVWLNYSAKNNRDVTLDGNYIAGGNSALTMSEWLRAKVANNTFISFEGLVGIIMPSGVPTSAYAWDSNTYYINSSASPSPFALTSEGKFSSHSFKDWQSKTGFDRNSRLISAGTGRPTGVKIAVRPNQYEQGRANIVVYNWDRQSSVEVDVSQIIQRGARYEVRNALDYFGAPVVSGAYDGRPISLPMTGTTTGPEFNAFVLLTLPGQSTSTNPTPTPTPAPTPAPTPTPTPTPAPTPTPEPSDQNSNLDPSFDEEEKKLLELINNYRLERGLSLLGASISLTSASHWHSKDMTEHNYLNRIDSLGRTPSKRARDFGFPGERAAIEENALVAVSHLSPEHIFDTWRSTASGNFILLKTSWKVAGVARSFDQTANRWFWSVTFGAYWDKTILLAGEDEQGRIDRNDLIRTRPLAESLSAGHRFSGYGDDDAPYDPVHCDIDSSPQICWRDPPPQTNTRLNEPSLQENLLGRWQVQYTISSQGVVHANLGKWDRTGFSIEFQIYPGGSWTMRGYRTSQSPQPIENGSWQSSHDSFRNEEIVTFIRQNGAPRATIRVHAAQGQLTFFAVDGGGIMRNFLRGVAADNNRNDDPQIIFLPKE